MPIMLMARTTKLCHAFYYLSSVLCFIFRIGASMRSRLLANFKPKYMALNASIAGHFRRTLKANMRLPSSIIFINADRIDARKTGEESGDTRRAAFQDAHADDYGE